MANVVESKAEAIVRVILWAGVGDERRATIAISKLHLVWPIILSPTPIRL